MGTCVFIWRSRWKERAKAGSQEEVQADVGHCWLWVCVCVCVCAGVIFLLLLMLLLMRRGMGEGRRDVRCRLMRVLYDDVYPVILLLI